MWAMSIYSGGRERAYRRSILQTTEHCTKTDYLLGKVFKAIDTANIGKVLWLLQRRVATQTYESLHNPFQGEFSLCFFGKSSSLSGRFEECYHEEATY